MTLDQFNDAVRQDPLVAQAFTDQATASIAWNKLVAAKLGPEVNVTQQDIDDEMRRVTENLGKPEYQIARNLPGGRPAGSGRGGPAIGRPPGGAAAPGSRIRAARRPIFAIDDRRPTAASSAGSGPISSTRSWPMPCPTCKPGQFDGPIRSTGGYYILELQAYPADRQGRPRRYRRVPEADLRFRAIHPAQGAGRRRPWPRSRRCGRASPIAPTWTRWPPKSCRQTPSTSVPRQSPICPMS